MATGNPHFYIQNILLALPEDIPTNRALWLVLSFWKIEGDGFGLLPVGFSDHPLLGETHVILDELVLPETVASANLAEAPGRFANGFVLQAASIPGRAQAGEELEVTFRWGLKAQAARTGRSSCTLSMRRVARSGM